MDDLIVFLTARLDELEFAGWHTRDCQITRPLPGLPSIFGTTMSCNCPVPERLMADVASRRKLIAWALDDDDHGLTPIRADGMINGEWGSGDADSPELTWQLLKLLAEPFAWHRDYRQEWRP